jgi:hypothetical protein
MSQVFPGFAEKQELTTPAAGFHTDEPHVMNLTSRDCPMTDIILRTAGGVADWQQVFETGREPEHRNDDHRDGRSCGHRKQNGD